MENNENFVTDEVTENVEATTTEEIVETPPKLYTEDELNAKVNEIAGKRAARIEKNIRRKVEREYSKYDDLIGTLEAGTGKKGVEELNEAFTDFYKSKIKDFKANKKPEYSAKEIETLARAEADEIIRSGFDEVVDEVDRMTELGFSNLSAKEKEVFSVLAEHRQNAERTRELEKIGVTKDIYDSQEFKDFEKMFTKDTPIQKVYETYNKTLPKKEFKTAGSMKQTQNEGVKDYYTPEEIERLTEEELDDPKVWEAVRRSMTGR